MPLTCPHCGAQRTLDISTKIRKYICVYCGSEEIVSEFESRESYIFRAKDALKGKDFSRAIGFCNHILDKNPSDWEANWLMTLAECSACDEGSMVTYDKKPLKSFESFLRAKANAPHDKLLMMGEYEEAVYNNLLRPKYTQLNNLKKSWDPLENTYQEWGKNEQWLKQEFTALNNMEKDSKFQSPYLMAQRYQGILAKNHKSALDKIAFPVIGVVIAIIWSVVLNMVIESEGNTFSAIFSNSDYFMTFLIGFIPLILVILVRFAKSALTGGKEKRMQKFVDVYLANEERLKQFRSTLYQREQITNLEDEIHKLEFELEEVKMTLSGRG